MGASSGIKAGEQPSAETLLDAFKTIGDADRARHASVLEYWLSIRGNRELPPLRDLDPLEISDAGPDSVLLELIGGGEDATIRYIGAVLKPAAEVEHIAEAPRSSILASIAKKLSIVAISRNFLAFEDEFANAGATTRCWVTLLPLSSAGAWVDYVYAFVTFDADAAQTVVEPEVASDEPVVDSDVLELAAEDEVAAEPEAEAFELTETADAQPVEPVEAELPAAEVPSSEVEAPPVEPADPKSPIAAPTAKSAGFSFDAVAASGGFYATKAVKVGPRPVPSAPDTAESFEEAPAATVDQQESASGHQQQTIPVADEPAAHSVAEEPAPAAVAEDKAGPPSIEQPQPSQASEGTLQDKLEDVRVKADEARQAKLRANAALYEGLSAAYDFALDAESSPEEYLRMCEAKGLKIQLRSPMKPVAKLAFDGMCDDSTIAQLETVLAWAFKHDLPKGSLAERIEEEGGLAPILGQAKAA